MKTRIPTARQAKPFDLAEMRAWVEKNERKDFLWYGQGAMSRLKLALDEIERVQVQPSFFSAAHPAVREAAGG